MMSRCFVLLCLFLCFLPYEAYSSECQDKRPNTVLTYKINQPKKIRTANVSALSKRMNAEEGRKVLGTAGTSVGFNYRVETQVKSQGNHFCMSVKRIKVHFYAKPVIHVASNFRSGSCEYNAVMRHELGHVAITKETHREYVPRFRTFLRHYGGSLTPYSTQKKSELNALYNRYVSEIGEALEEYLTEIQDDLSARQDEYDSEEEYQRVADECDDWDEEIADE